MNSPSKEIWIGLIGVKAARRDILPGAEGAYTNAVAMAQDRQSYCAAVRWALKENEMEPFEFEDVEPLRVRLSWFEVPLSIISMAEQTETDGRVRFGEFFLYEP